MILIYQSPYHKLISTIGLNTAPSGFTTNRTLITDNLTNANTKSRMRMVTLYQIAGVVKGIVVGTGNKVEDYGVGFYTKYGDGGVDIAPIADLYKTEVWLLGEYLEVDEREYVKHLQLMVYGKIQELMKSS